MQPEDVAQLSEGSTRECPVCQEQTFRFSRLTQLPGEQAPRGPGWLCVNPLCRHWLFPRAESPSSAGR